MAKLTHQPIDKDDWIRIMRRAELPFTTKGIAAFLTFFADKDGSRVRPGEARLAVETGLTPRAIREHMDVLRAAGLIERVNRGTAVRGRADVYQLTVPGAGHEPVPMRTDPDGNRLTPERPVRKRAKKAAEPVPDPVTEAAAAPEDTGTVVPETDPLTGTGVPVDNPVTGTGVPVDDETYRNRGAGNVLKLVTTYRNHGSDLPEPLSRLTGTGVPPTTHTTHDHPSIGSLQVGTSPTEPSLINPGNPNEVDQGSGTANGDAELEAAQAVLAAMRRPVADAWRHAARAELEADDIPLSRRAVEIRAAELATTHTTEKTGT